MDIPRGARFVRENAIIMDLRWRVEDHEVDLILSDGDDGIRFVIGLPYDKQIEIDEDTPERQARLDLARKIVQNPTSHVRLGDLI